MYRPKDRDELEQLIVDCYYGDVYLKDIDTSNITDMGSIFDVEHYRDEYDIYIDILWENPNNDITKWDISNVTNMCWMFRGCEFNQDISNWNVSNVADMGGMFYGSEFNGDISLWILSLNPNVDMKWINESSSHSEIYGEINNYEDFVKTVNWDVVKNRIHDIMDNDSDSERYKLLKKLNSIKQFSGVDLDISK